MVQIDELTATQQVYMYMHETLLSHEKKQTCDLNLKDLKGKSHFIYPLSKIVLELLRKFQNLLEIAALTSQKISARPVVTICNGKSLHCYSEQKEWYRLWHFFER